MKKYLNLFLILILMLFICAYSNESTSNKEKEIEEEQVEKEEKITLDDVDRWLTKIWNDGICEISWYLNSGTSSTGETLDIDFTIEVFNKNFKEKDKYINYIDSLDDNDDYHLIKVSFQKAIEQMTIINEKVNETLPVPKADVDYEENIDLFKQYMYTFDDELYELEK